MVPPTTVVNVPADEIRKGPAVPLAAESEPHVLGPIEIKDTPGTAIVKPQETKKNKHVFQKSYIARLLYY